MALGEENGMSTTMLVSPSGGINTGYAYPAPVYYGGNVGGNTGFGGDWGSLITLFLLFGMFGGGFGGFGGMGGFGGYDFPWLLTGQQGISNNVNSGFRDAQISDGITSVRDGISSLSTQLCGCCGDMQLGMANGFNGVNNAIFGAQNALAQQMYTNQLADLERSYAAQTATAQGFNTTGAGISDLKFTIAQEECATRSASAMNTRDIIDATNRGQQAILDKLCALELDAARRENEQLRTELIFARGQASKTAQTADIRAGQLAATTALVQELRSCPIPSQPVYGNSPIFSCPVNLGQNSGCGCNGFAA